MLAVSSGHGQRPDFYLTIRQTMSWTPHIAGMAERFHFGPHPRSRLLCDA